MNRDLTADLHGHAIDYANDLDRRYFAEHPDCRRYFRSPVRHEWCADFRLSGCLQPDEEPWRVVVQAVEPGCRIRSPHFLVAPWTDLPAPPETPPALNEFLRERGIW